MKVIGQWVFQSSAVGDENLKLKAQQKVAGEHKDWWHELRLNNAKMFPSNSGLFCFGDSMSQHVAKIIFWKSVCCATWALETKQ